MRCFQLSKNCNHWLEKSVGAGVDTESSQLPDRDGGAVFFYGNQYRLEVGGQDYFVDLLLFHRRLRCLVAIELKIGDFKPEHKGKMEFYLEALDTKERIEGENPPIGIII